MRFGAGLLIGLALGGFLISPQQAAVQIAQGDPAPFAGVLIPESRYRAMAQATLDLPLCQEQNAVWLQAHSEAMGALQEATALLGQCRPKKTAAESALDIVAKAGLLVVPLVCAFSSGGDTIVIPE